MLQYKKKLEKSEKSAKNTKHRIPPGGMGVGSKEPTQSNYFYY